MRDGEGGSVTAAISAVAGLTILPRALTAFRARMPRAALSFSEASLPISKDELALGRLDFVVLHECANEGDDGFARELLFESPLVVVARNAHPLRRVGSLAALRDQTWLFPGSARSGDLPLLQAFRSLRLAPPGDVILCASLTAALRIIQQSDALAFVSRYMFSGHPFAGRIGPLALKENLPVAKVVVLTRRGSPLTHPARQFVDCLRDAARHMVPTAPGVDVKGSR
ncbi:MAG: LysR substrate-binding domain-containing protein [Rubrivivax sp.]